MLRLTVFFKILLYRYMNRGSSSHWNTSLGFRPIKKVESHCFRMLCWKDLFCGGTLSGNLPPPNPHNTLLTTHNKGCLPCQGHQGNVREIWLFSLTSKNGATYLNHHFSPCAIIYFVKYTRSVMKVMFVLLAKRTLSEVVEGVNSKIVLLAPSAWSSPLFFCMNNAISL